MKNVLMLGATSDMAQAIARKYAAEGWSLSLAARDVGLMEPMADDLRVRYKASVKTYLFDATTFGKHAAFYASLETPPDLVVCAFGYLGDEELARTDFEEARRIAEVNYLGAVSVLNVVAEDFERRGRGCIVGIGSVAGDRGRASNGHYGSAKAAFATYLSALRNRLAKSHVRVLTVKPGFCRTKMTENLDLPPALTAEPEEVAEALFRAVRRGRNEIYVLWPWRWIMMAIVHLPEFVFKRLKL